MWARYTVPLSDQRQTHPNRFRIKSVPPLFIIQSTIAELYTVAAKWSVKALAQMGLTSAINMCTSPHPRPRGTQKAAQPQVIDVHSISTIKIPRRSVPDQRRSGCVCLWSYRGTSLTRERPHPGPYRRPMPRVLGGSYVGGRFLMGEVPLYTASGKIPLQSTPRRTVEF